MVVRAGLKYVLASDPELVFCGEHSGGKGAVDFISKVQPDVTLMDVRMPDLSGVEALREILAVHPREHIVMLTTSDAAEDVFRAIEEGARGYVMKESPIEIITAAVRAAHAGEVYMSDDVRRIYETRKAQPGLARRETEVLALVAQGMNNRAIGERLGVSENSVKMQLKRIYFKLNVSDRAEAVTTALQRGLIEGVKG
jgi:two-component system NarL family response regulator